MCVVDTPWANSIYSIIYSYLIDHEALHVTAVHVCISFHHTASGAQAFLDISSVPTLRDVSELILTKIAAKWQKVALSLGVEDCVIAIVSRNHPTDCEGACLDMLERWLSKERHTGEVLERRWSALLTTLGRAGFVDLEISLRREHFKLPSEL